MDITTYCDIYTCEDCPRYGDDCDGDKRVEHTDLISRANAIRWVKTECNQYGKPTLDYDSGLKVIEHLKKMPSEQGRKDRRMSDLISRQAAIEETWKEPSYTDPLNVLAELRDRIKDLPSAQPEQRWIPCSERLPKEKARVLTYDSMGDIVFGQYDKGRWYWEAEACADYWAKNDGVIAWMPLPKPYECGARMKGGDNE